MCMYIYIYICAEGLQAHRPTFLVPSIRRLGSVSSSCLLASLEAVDLAERICGAALSPVAWGNLLTSTSECWEALALIQLLVFKHKTWLVHAVVLSLAGMQL